MRRLPHLALLLALALAGPGPALAVPRPAATRTVATPEEQLWLDRLGSALTASRVLAEDAMRSGDSYMIGREGGNYTQALVAAFRATSDKQYLDRVLELSELARAQLRDAWLDGTTDGYTAWPWRIDPANATYYGKDTNWLDESISSGTAALWMWALHANRALDPDYGPAADFWRGWIEGQFLGKWYARAGSPLAAWNTPYAGFYKPDTEPRSANWRLAWYLWRVTGNAFYRDRAEEIRLQLERSLQVNPAVPGAWRWARQLDPGTGEWQAVNYANYMARVVVEMNLEGVAFFSEPLTMQRFAGTFRDVVYDATLPGRTTMRNDVGGGGSTGYALYAFHAFAPWDASGFLMSLAHQSVTPPTSYASGGSSKAARNDVSIASYALLALAPGGTTSTQVARFEVAALGAGQVRIGFELSAAGGAVPVGVWRAVAGGAEWEPVSPAQVRGAGGHEVTDTPPAGPQVWWYELRAGAGAGTEVLARSEVRLDAEVALAMDAAQPSPFTTSTLVRFRLPAPAWARVRVQDAAGRQLRVLHDGPLAAGSQALAWDGRATAGAPVPAGLYLVSVEAAGRRATQRLVRMR
jgi:hypothetical protein